jgi:hypothetical protein
MSEAKWSGILQTLDSRTELLGLITLIAEALFLGAAALLPREQVIYALIVCALILIVTIVGIVRIETADRGGRAATVTDLVPSSLTPDSPLLKELIDSAIQTMCRAVSLNANVRPQP